MNQVLTKDKLHKHAYMEVECKYKINYQFEINGLNIENFSIFQKETDVTYGYEMLEGNSQWMRNTVIVRCWVPIVGMVVTISPSFSL